MSPDERCYQLAMARLGILTRADAAQAGLGPRQLRHRVRAGRLIEEFPGVYRYPGSPIAWKQAVCAAQAWAGDGSAASGRCAAALWELSGILPNSIEITSPRYHRPPGPSVIIRRAHLEKSEMRSRDGITVTAPERTLLDLGRAVTRRALESALDDALCKRLTTPHRLSLYLDERGAQGRNGTAPLRALVDQLDESPGTDRFERLLSAALVSRSLPKPAAQHRVRVDGQTFYLDFAYPAARLGIEAHSFKHHSRRSDWERDQARHDTLTSAGWSILYVTWRRLRDHPDLVAADVRRSLKGFVQQDDNKLAL